MPKLHAGTGRKYCKHCKTICLAAKKICINPSCLQPFVKKINPNNPPPEVEGRKTILIPGEYAGYRILLSIHTPAGHCPIIFPKLIMEDYESSKHLIEAWAHEVRKYFLSRKSEWFLNNALFYYAKQSYSIGTAECELSRKVISEIPDIQRIEV